MDVVAAPVLAYIGEVLSGVRQYTLEPPVIPGAGAIGRVRTIGPDATKLKVGDWVHVRPDTALARRRDRPRHRLAGPQRARRRRTRATTLFSQTAPSPSGYAFPTENAAAIGAIEAGEAAKWCAIGRLLVPFGGWLRVGLQAGETALVNGATGAFGSAAVAVALAIGAGRVVATGRNAQALDSLVRQHGPRVRTVVFSGDEARDREAMQAAAGGPIDAVLDILPPGADPTWARAAVMAVRINGRAVLMGGVGMQGGGGLDLPYAWMMRNGVALYGQWIAIRTGRAAAATEPHRDEPKACHA